VQPLDCGGSITITKDRNDGRLRVLLERGHICVLWLDAIKPRSTSRSVAEKL
jgi:hypothetical protein